MTFYVFFELPHTFSRTLPTTNSTRKYSAYILRFELSGIVSSAFISVFRNSVSGSVF